MRSNILDLSLTNGHRFSEIFFPIGVISLVVPERNRSEKMIHNGFVAHIVIITLHLIFCSNYIICIMGQWPWIMRNKLIIFMRGGDYKVLYVLPRQSTCLTLTYKLNADLGRNFSVFANFL